MVSKLQVLYISGLDSRRTNQINTPFLHNALQNYPWATINTVPVYDLLPVVLTGVYPPTQGNEVRLNPDLKLSTKSEILNLIPDFLAITFQCFMHFLSRSFDLAAIPPKRRRKLLITRSRYINRNVINLLEFNGLKTIFNIAGAINSEYIFTKKQTGLNKLIDESTKSQRKLKFFEIYCLDDIQHWNLDNPAKVNSIYKKIDEFIKNVYEQCNKLGIKLVIISANGQELVKGSINIIKEIEKLNLSDNDFTYFIEPAKARFWFHSDNAGKKVIEKLSTLKNGELLTYEDFQSYNLNYNKDYGEIFFVPEPGYIFFPHDFYHPIANLFLGLTNSQERSRICNPRHRGFHHYLPHNESEKGFILFLDDRYNKIKEECDIIDIAPTILELIGLNKSESMLGDSIFKH